MTVMKHFQHTIVVRVSLLLYMLLLSITTIAQNNEMKDFNVDSTLYVYYQQCKGYIQSPIVLIMSDTLFQMAKSQNDQRMQAVALCTKLDFYYFHAQEDSIVSWVERIKEFALTTNQSKYYYFAWGKRLILYYIKSGKINTALYQSQLMLKDAIKRDDKEGMAYCYDCIGDIYIIKKLNEQAINAKLKAVEIIETYNLNSYNLFSKLATIAKLYSELSQPQKAIETIEKGEKYIYTSLHKADQKLSYVYYYLVLKQYDKAQKYLKEAEDIHAKDKRLKHQRKNLLDAEESYYRHTGQFQKALKTLEYQEKIVQSMGEDQTELDVMLKRGDLYYQMGQKAIAADYLYNYITLSDSANNVNEQSAVTEFSTILNLEKLKTEKKELELKSKEEQLKYNRNFIILLAIILFIVVVLFYREYHLNKRLKISERQLVLKNKKLTESEENLRKARDKAEKASEMKTSFIRNMTHEIRTPLNSIVGFSQIIASQFKKDEDTYEFANIIGENSDKLLKLIDDVLNISDLESSEELVLTSTRINSCCQNSLERVRPYIPKSVTLEFHPAYDDLTILTDEECVSKILFNLLHNAAKFTEKGQIILAYALSENKEKLIITVTDTGIGIPADKQEEVFERFTKISSFSQGCGLGLPLSKLLAQKLGGDLRIDKNYLSGCRFVLTLPINT